MPHTCVCIPTVMVSVCISRNSIVCGVGGALVMTTRRPQPRTQALSSTLPRYHSRYPERNDESHCIPHVILLRHAVDVTATGHERACLSRVSPCNADAVAFILPRYAPNIQVAIDRLRYQLCDSVIMRCPYPCMMSRAACKRVWSSSTARPPADHTAILYLIRCTYTRS